MAKARSSKSSSKKSPATSAKKASTKKSTTKKQPAAKKPATKKAVTKKAAAKKTGVKKKAAKNASTVKSTAGKTSGKASASKATTKKSTAAKKTSKAKSTKADSKKTTSVKASPSGGTGNGSGSTGGSSSPTRPKKIKTNLDRKQLAHFRELLLEKRAELVGDLSGMENSALRSEQSNLSTMPQHMADMGSDSYDQDLTLGLMESERQLLVEIDEALERIADGTFGVCVEMGKPINKARLEVKPWAKYCIEAARAMEGQRR